MDILMTSREVCARGWGTPMNGERTVTTDDDCGLVARFLKGDAAAFDTLFSKYQDYVYNIVYGVVGSAEESRDLTQEVFVQVYRSLPRFRQGARFATWLYRIALNKAVDAARGSRKWRFLPLLDDPGVAQHRAAEEDEPEFMYAQGEAREDIQKVLMRCPLGHREILVLRYYQDMSIDEIAETMDCSLAAAKVRLHRARRAFKENYIATHGLDTMDKQCKANSETVKPAR